MSPKKFKRPEPRLFRLKHALLCNPTVGPSLIQHWAKQEYLVHGTERHGSVERLTFSFPELVYLGFLVRLSWFGAVTKETLVKYDARPYSPEAGTPRECKLSQSTKVYFTLKFYDWNAIITVTAVQGQVATPTTRSKQVSIRYVVLIHDVDPAAEELSIRRDGDFTDAAVFIDLHQIHEAVKETLGIS